MLEIDQVDPAERLIEIRQRMSLACDEAGQEITDVTVTAVSKKHLSSHIKRALDAGHLTFGENRVQEAMGKWPGLLEQYDGIDLRLIGPLQSNKVKDAVALFTAIETVDRPKLARALADEMDSQGKTLSLFCLLYTSPSPRDLSTSRMPSSA